MDQIATELLALSPQRKGRALPKPSPHELNHAVKHGLTIPVVIRAEQQYIHGRMHYEILANEKIWYIAQKLNISEVPITKIEISDEQVRELMQIIPDNPIDEALQIKKLLELHPQSIAEVARKLGRKRADVSNQLRLLTLDTYCQQLIKDKKFTMGQAKPLITLSSIEQRQLAQQALLNRWSTRVIEQKARELRRQNTHKPAKQNDANIAKLQNQIAEHVGCPVQLVDGKLIINYFDDLEILDGILSQMGLGQTQQSKPMSPMNIEFVV